MLQIRASAAQAIPCRTLHAPSNFFCSKSAMDNCRSRESCRMRSDCTSCPDPLQLRCWYSSLVMMPCRNLRFAGYSCGASSSSALSSSLHQPHPQSHPTFRMHLLQSIIASVIVTFSRICEALEVIVCFCAILWPKFLSGVEGRLVLLSTRPSTAAEWVPVP